MSTLHPPFAAGQLWRVHGRHDGERPTLLINYVERLPLGDEVFHVSICDIVLHNPRMPWSATTRLPHVPLSRPGLVASAAAFLRKEETDPDWRRAHARWRSSLAFGQAAVLDLPVAQALVSLQQAWLALQPDPSTEPARWL